MNKTIYIRDEDVPIWDRAKELAGDKLSPTIIAGLKRFIADHEAMAKSFERIEVSYNDADAHDVPKRKAFYGRWIFPPKKAIELIDEEDGTSYSYAVAVTAKGAAVVYRWESDAEGTRGYRLLTFPSLEQAASNKGVNYAVRKAIEAIGVPVEEMDI